MNIAETPELFKHKHYQTVREVIAKLLQENLLQYGAGFCLSMSDLVQNMLLEHGVKCSLLEVQLTVIGTNPPHLHVIGLQTAELTSGQIATHIVVVIEDENPLIIDTSISHQLPSPFTWVCVPVKNNEEEIARVNRNGNTLIYREKAGSKFPAIHQNNIKSRIELDKKFENSISNLNRANKIIVGLTTLIILLSVFVVGMTWHLYTIANRNYDRIQKIEASDDNLHDRVTSFTIRSNNFDDRLNATAERLNILDSRLADIEKLFHIKKK